MNSNFLSYVLKPDQVASNYVWFITCSGCVGNLFASKYLSHFVRQNYEYKIIMWNWFVLFKFVFNVANKLWTSWPERKDWCQGNFILAFGYTDDYLFYQRSSFFSLFRDRMVTTARKDMLVLVLHRFIFRFYRHCMLTFSSTDPVVDVICGLECIAYTGS